MEIGVHLGVGILVTFLGKDNNIESSPIVTRSTGYTKGLCCPSISYKNDRPFCLNKIKDLLFKYDLNSIFSFF